MKFSAFTKPLLWVLASLLLILSLASCGVTLQSGENGLYDERHDISYNHASPVYEAISLVKEYGKLNVTEQESYVLHTIPGTDPTKMLATEDFNIVYASDIDMPTLMQMAPTILRICNDSLEIKRLEDAVAIAALVNTYETGTSIDYPGLTPIRSYKARFESVLYPGFYYTLTYVEYDTDLKLDDVNYGKYFLYNAFDKRFIPIDDTIHTALGLA
ncbi:MAG: hypothetical protein IJD38_06980 [Clostridia bacterium]|nr:hypothetical protein [Clostridia bacterium]